MTFSKERGGYLPFVVACSASALVLFGTLYFAALRPEYRHRTHTISELGEFGDPRSAIVSYAVFLPTGLAVWAALLFAYWPVNRASALSAGLAAFASLGLGYVGAAFFPCDPGAPVIGSWRQQVHTIVGFLEYFGAVVGLLLLGIHSVRTASSAVGVGLLLAATVVLVCLVLLSIPALIPVRGAVQRVAEISIFVALCTLCHPQVASMLAPNASVERTCHPRP